MAKTICFTSGELWFIANALVLAGEEYSRLAEVKIYPERLRAEFRLQRDEAKRLASVFENAEEAFVKVD